MIKVTIYKTGDEIKGFMVEGHSITPKKDLT